MFSHFYVNFGVLIVHLLTSVFVGHNGTCQFYTLLPSLIVCCGSVGNRIIARSQTIATLCESYATCVCMEMLSEVLSASFVMVCRRRKYIDSLVSKIVSVLLVCAG